MPGMLAAVVVLLVILLVVGEPFEVGQAVVEGAREGASRYDGPSMQRPRSITLY